MRRAWHVTSRRVFAVYCGRDDVSARPVITLTTKLPVYIKCEDLAAVEGRQACLDALMLQVELAIDRKPESDQIQLVFLRKPK